jgi:hypothetical protein
LLPEEKQEFCKKESRKEIKNCSDELHVCECVGRRREKEKKKAHPQAK